MKNNNIPKIIHYCWLGGAPLPDVAVRCIESWKKYCPNYEIKRWDESNFDVNCCDYVKEAYAAKNWAFVSDFARFKVLHDNGGVYFDIDVELIKPIDDIVASGAFMACELTSKRKQAVAPGLGVAVEAGNLLCSELLESYYQDHYVLSDDSYNSTTVVARTVNHLQKHGFNIDISDIQCIEGITIYPDDYFCPTRYWTDDTHYTENTHSIHHYSALWKSKTDNRVSAIRKKYATKGKFGIWIYRFLAAPLVLHSALSKKISKISRNKSKNNGICL